MFKKNVKKKMINFFWLYYLKYFKLIVLFINMKFLLIVIKEDELLVIKKIFLYENVINNNCLSSGNINLLVGKWKFFCLILF